LGVSIIRGPAGSGGYASYTAMETTMEIGTNYTITVTNGYPYVKDRCGIWIDWNQILILPTLARR